MKLISLCTSVLMFLLLVLGASAFIIDDWTNVYRVNTIQQSVMKENCIDERTELNGTVHPERCFEIHDYYVPKNITTGKVIGITDGITFIPNAHKTGNKVSIWTVPLGDRNFEEFGKCRDYERQKGVCEIK